MARGIDGRMRTVRVDVKAAMFCVPKETVIALFVWTHELVMRSATMFAYHERARSNMHPIVRATFGSIILES